jgi:hypothetical protein
MISESAADVTLDPDTIRKELSFAPSKFKELKYNVDDFNSWVLLKIKQLRQHGQESSDLRTHLFSAYKSSEDKEFVTYINAVKDGLRDTRTNIRPKQLLAKAKLKAEELDKDRKFANIDSEGSDQLLALKAEFAQKLSALETKVTASGGNGGTHAGQKKRGKGKPFPAELKEAPRPSDPSKPKVISGVEYWWCDGHGKWGQHQIYTCRKKMAMDSGAAGNTGDTGGGDTRRERAIQAAVAAAMTNYSSDSSDE